VTAHVFVDESKAHGYLLAAAVLLADDLAYARKTVVGLRLRGQRGIHFKKEQDSRRRTIVGSLADTGASVLIYDAVGYRSELIARQACLERLIEDLASLGAGVLTLDRDDSLVESDRQWLYRAVRAAGSADTVTYQHRRRSEECLLTVPDAVAWCWAKGGNWKRLAQPLVKSVTRLRS
jgi:hypothetical protein